MNLADGVGRRLSSASWPVWIKRLFKLEDGPWCIQIIYRAYSRWHEGQRVLRHSTNFIIAGMVCSSPSHDIGSRIPLHMRVSRPRGETGQALLINREVQRRRNYSKFYYVHEEKSFNVNSDVGTTSVAFALLFCTKQNLQHTNIDISIYWCEEMLQRDTLTRWHCHVRGRNVLSKFCCRRRDSFRDTIPSKQIEFSYQSFVNVFIHFSRLWNRFSKNMPPILCYLCIFQIWIFGIHRAWNILYVRAWSNVGKV